MFNYVCIHVYASVCVQAHAYKCRHPRKSNIPSPRVIIGCKQPAVGTGSSSRSLEEQCALSSSKASLKPKVVFFFNIITIYICPPFALPPHPHVPPLPVYATFTPPLFLLRKWQAYQVALRLGTSPQIKSSQGNSVGGKWSQEQGNVSDIAGTPLLGVPQNPELHNYNLYAESLSQTPAGSLGVSVQSQGGPGRPGLLILWG